LLGCRRRGSRPPQASGPRRPGQRRLVPGDTVVGALLFGAFAGPCLDDWDSIPSLPESALGASQPAKHPPVDSEVWSALDGDRNAFSPTSAPGPTPSGQPPGQESTPGAGRTTRDAEPGWEALSAVFAAAGSPHLLALAGTPGLNAAPGAGTTDLPTGVEHV